MITHMKTNQYKSAWAIIVITLINACAQPKPVQSIPLCDRNEYSRNGVACEMVYQYTATNGEFDLSSKTLYSTEKYDSLGNVIYYKGKDSPLCVSYAHYSAIRNALYEHKNDMFTYKMEYKDTVLTKVALFNESGEYFARIEHFIAGNEVTDSAYVLNRLVFVQKTFLDKQGRDSLRLTYNTENSMRVELAEKEESSYTDTEKGVQKETCIQYSRGYDYSRTHKFEKRTSTIERRFDEKGRLIYLNINGRSIQSITFDESGLKSECVAERRYSNEQTKSLYVTERYENGLRNMETLYADMTIPQRKTVHEYEFFTYSPNYSSKK